VRTVPKRTRESQLDLARRIDGVIGELLEMGGEGFRYQFGGVIRPLRRLVRTALDDPSMLDDPDGREDFAMRLREHLPSGSGMGTWGDWNAPNPFVRRSLDLKDELQALVYRT
jgi:hypothetical protein